MASKGPKATSVAQATKPVIMPATDPAVNVPPALASTPDAKLVAPVAPKPEAKSEAAVEAPSAPAPVVEAPRPVDQAPVEAIAPEPIPVITPELPPVAAPAAVLQKEIKTMATTFQSATDTAQAQAKTMFGDVNERAKNALEKGSKAFEDLNDFSKGNVEAFVESSKIAAKGAEDIARYTTDYVKASVEKATATAQQYAAVKSPTELFKLQSEQTRHVMDSMMAETAKFTENYLKLLGEIAQPISNRVALAAEKMKIAA